MVNPDKPHAFRVRVITDTRLRDNVMRKHTPHYRDEPCPEGFGSHSPRYMLEKPGPGPERTCDICGGSEQLLIHDVEAARFRHKYGLDIGLTWAESWKVPHMAPAEKRERREYLRAIHGREW